MLDNSASSNTIDDGYYKVVKGLHSNMQALKNAICDLRTASNVHIFEDDISNLLTNVSEELFAYRSLYPLYVSKSSSNVLNSACGKDQITHFNQVIDQLVVKIRDLKEYIMDTHFSDAWPSLAYDYLKVELAKLCSAIDTLLVMQEDIFVCAYYNDIGVLD